MKEEKMKKLDVDKLEQVVGGNFNKLYEVENDKMLYRSMHRLLQQVKKECHGALDHAVPAKMNAACVRHNIYCSEDVIIAFIRKYWEYV